MPTLRPLDIHRRMMASAGDIDICWWYLGTTFVRLDNYPEIAALQAETIMIYRPETLSPSSYRLHWREIGYFRDPVSGEVAVDWLNPITGETVATPTSFEEGPSAYTITANDGSLVIDLEQAHATVLGIDVNILPAGSGRLNLVQQERKERGFPLPDGTMPAAGSTAVSKTTTELSLFADRAGLDTAMPDLNCTGIYTFELATLPPWMGFGDRHGSAIVKGIMRKAPLQAHVNAVAWNRLRTAFPGYFSGDLLVPPW